MQRKERIAAIQRRLVAWYRRRKRDLPWRRRSDPYAIWISEVMLQQTRVETVTKYYARFLSRFPTVRDLAAAEMDDVLKAWEGMGYYSRARNLRRAAGEVVRAHGGRLPRDVATLRTLPGVGRYTAGAIASIAFGLDEPVLDGNVTRVLCRWFAVRRSVDLAATREKLWKLARAVISPGEASLLNQAMMDLGATVCTPRKPACGECPVAEACLAQQRGVQEALPVKRAKKPTPHYDVVVGLIRRADGKLLIGRRPEEGLLGGLWELPGGKIEPGETHAEALEREIREETGVTARIGDRVASVRHAYSHFRITMHAYRARRTGGRARPLGCSAVRWVRRRELGDYAFPAATLRVFERMGDSEEGAER